MTSKFLKTRFCSLIKWHVIFPLIAFRISFPFVLNYGQRFLHELNEVNPFFYANWSARLWNLMMCKKILSKIYPYAQFENVFWKFWILLTLEKEWFLILKEHLLILKNNPQDFFFFSFWICTFWKPVAFGDHAYWALDEWMGS